MFFLRVFQKLHGPLIVIIAMLSAIGVAVLYSAARGSMEPWASRHMARFAMGFALMLGVALVNIKFWFRISYLAYALGLLALLAVELAGVEGGLGAQRWLNVGGFQFQPSELMKILLVLTLARYFHGVHRQDIQRLASLFMPLALTGIAALLVLRQPNLGTAAIMVMTAAILTFMAGVGWKKFLAAGILVLTLLPLGWHVMHDYQKKRVEVFLNPESDPLGAGYNIIQSKIAIGSGGVWGRGFLQGSQSQLSFVPERQTDFIFAIVAEEFGLAGSLFLLLLYALLILCGVQIAVSCESQYARLTSFGITSLLFLYVFVNAGMVSGLLPVVGVPLPLLSYGGSSMLATLVGCGFILNAYMYRDAIITQGW